MGFRDARISAGLSVSQVMKNIGVSDAAVYQWETGVTRPNAKRLLEIARLALETLAYHDKNYLDSTFAKSNAAISEEIQACLQKALTMMEEKQ